jgi:hypothetical protein
VSAAGIRCGSILSLDLKLMRVFGLFSRIHVLLHLLASQATNAQSAISVGAK